MKNCYVLNRVRRYGSTGHEYREFIGVYSCLEKLNEQIEHCQYNDPTTDDNPYFFEIHTGPIDIIGMETKEHYKTSRFF